MISYRQETLNHFELPSRTQFSEFLGSPALEGMLGPMVTSAQRGNGGVPTPLEGEESRSFPETSRRTDLIYTNIAPKCFGFVTIGIAIGADRVSKSSEVV
jgi:hypothetical protein